jgi:DNA-binding FrmR family transcriptional regulator
MNREELVKIEQRLHIILEELIAVTHMLEDGEACSQILQKMGTARRALRALEYSLIACQLRESIALIQNNPDPDTQSIELSRLRDLYIEVIRMPFLKNEVKP